MATVREDVNTDIVIKQKVVTSGIAFQVELSNYYTKEEVDALIPSGFITEIPSEYITESELNSKGYINGYQLMSNYYSKSEVDSKIASNFDSTQYYTKSDIDNKGYLTEHQSLEGYALKSEIPDTTGLATKTELTTAIGNIDTILDNINGEVV